MRRENHCIDVQVVHEIKYDLSNHADSANTRALVRICFASLFVAGLANKPCFSAPSQVFVYTTWRASLRVDSRNITVNNKEGLEDKDDEDYFEDNNTEGYLEEIGRERLS